MQMTVRSRTVWLAKTQNSLLLLEHLLYFTIFHIIFLKMY